MKIEHIAIWVKDLEKMRCFYELYFDGKANMKYKNTKKEFESYFIAFEDGARLELMHSPALAEKNNKNTHGLAHFAMNVGSKSIVDTLTKQLRQDGYAITGEPRTTGDGYYESVVLDPEGNTIEITC